MKVFMDTVHGSIPVSQQEVEVIDHPLFQRLRFIRQTDVMHLTFMGAGHTRFAHSLGVMHIGSRLFERLFPLEEMLVTEATYSSRCYLRDVLRAALLLHDTGHSGYSHLVESHLVDRGLFTAERLARAIGSSCHPEIVEVAMKGAKDGIRHENYSISCAINILSACGRDNDFVWDVLSLMEGFPSQYMSDRYAESSFSLMSSLFPEFQFSGSLTPGEEVRRICSMIVSGEVDADKLDYVLRDGLYSGVAYGFFDIEGIINNFAVGFDDSTQRFCMTMGQVGLSSLIDLVDSRHNLFLNILNHDGNNGIEVLFKLALDEVFSDDASIANICAMLESSDSWAFFTDDYVNSMISTVAMRDRGSFCYRYLFRQQLLHAKTLFNPDEAEVDKKRRELTAIHGDGKVHTNTSSIKFSRICKGWRDIMVRVKTGDPEHPRQLQEIVSCTDYFNRASHSWRVGFYRS